MPQKNRSTYATITVTLTIRRDDLAEAKERLMDAVCGNFDGWHSIKDRPATPDEIKGYKEAFSLILHPRGNYTSDEIKGYKEAFKEAFSTPEEIIVNNDENDLTPEHDDG